MHYSLTRNWNALLTVRRAPTGRDVHFGEPTQGCAYGLPWAISTAPRWGANRGQNMQSFIPPWVGENQWKAKEKPLCKSDKRMERRKRQGLKAH
jgi:hypothetical protein